MLHAVLVYSHIHRCDQGMLADDAYASTSCPGCICVPIVRENEHLKRKEKIDQICTFPKHDFPSANDTDAACKHLNTFTQKAEGYYSLFL